MVTGSIARRWAKALFDLGEESGALIGLVREIQRAADAWTSNEELRTALTNPLLSERTRAAVWDDVIRKLGATRVGRTALKLMFDKSRLPELPSIARELQRLSDIKDNRLRARITSAAPIDEQMVHRLRAALQRSTGKAVVVTTSVDEELIGGVVTRVGDLVFDGSIRTQLERIGEGMLGRR